MPKKVTRQEDKETKNPVEGEKPRRFAKVRSATAGLGKKKAVKPAVKRSKSGSRILQQPKRVWYNPLSWRHMPPVPNYKPLPKARILLWSVVRLLWANKALFGGIVIVYGIFNVLLVRGLSGSSDLSSIKSTLQDGGIQGLGGRLIGSTFSLGYLLASSGSSNSATSGIYQAMLLVICSLAFIWAFRSVLAKQKARVRDSFYKGMYPLIPFLLIFLLMSIQLIPLGVGATIFSTVTGSGIAAHWWETMLWLLFFICLATWSLRMITASIFALYICTLPDMAPLRAYRSARQLVYGRRLMLWRKIIFLPFVVLILAGVIEIPLILFLTPVAEWTFFIISMIAMPIVHGYLYNLYRDML